VFPQLRGLYKAPVLNRMGLERRKLVALILPSALLVSFACCYGPFCYTTSMAMVTSLMSTSHTPALAKKVSEPTQFSVVVPCSVEGCITTCYCLLHWFRPCGLIQIEDVLPLISHVVVLQEELKRCCLDMMRQLMVLGTAW
jgi:hypothetical protein